MDSLEDYVEGARAAAADRDWPRALALWEEADRKFPQHGVGVLGGGEALMQMDRLDEAEATFTEAIQRFPLNVWGAAGYAGIATRRRDWPEALLRWERVSQDFPDQAVGLLGKGEALREIGRLDEAEAVFADAMERFPTNVWAAANHAIIAARL